MAPILSRFTVALVLAACVACGASQRQTTIKAALVTVDASRDAFLAYDAKAQIEIVADGKTLEAVKQRLDAYRADRIRIVVVFDAAYHAIAAAAVAADAPSLAGMQAALAQLVVALSPYLQPNLKAEAPP